MSHLTCDVLARHEYWLSDVHARHCSYIVQFGKIIILYIRLKIDGNLNVVEPSST